MKTNKLIVRLKEGVKPEDILPASPSSSQNTIKRLYSIQDEIPDAKKKISKAGKQIISSDELFDREVYPLKNALEKKMFRTYQIECETNAAAESLYLILSKSKDIEFIQFDELNELYYKPNDPLLSKLWAIPKIACEAAWDTSQGEGITIAVIDTGVDYNHPDIAANMWKNAAGKYGYDFSDNDNDPKDYHGHGSHVAGTIAAVANNGIGIAGVAFKSKIMAVKIFPNAYDSVCAQAIKYAVDNGAKVLNNSWGPTARKVSNPTVEEAIDYAHSKGAIVVFAAGNANDDVQYYAPANYSKVISVAATDSNDKRASFSNYGSLITVAAPGVDIYSLQFNTSNYCYKSGTSMAAPHVAALAALLLKVDNKLTFSHVKALIQKYADKISTDKYIGTGRINANNTVKKATLENTVGYVLMLDTSGSMASIDKDSKEAFINLAKIDTKAFVRSTKPNDQFGVNQYSDNATWVYPKGSNPKISNVSADSHETQEAANEIEKLKTQNMTNMGAAFSLGNTMIKDAKTDVKAFVMLTDGMWNVGEDPTKVLKNEPPLFLIGFGYNMFDSRYKIQQLLDKNENSKYYYKPNAWEVMQMFNEVRALPVDVSQMINQVSEYKGSDYQLTDFIVSDGDSVQISVVWSGKNYQYTSGIPGGGKINVILIDPRGKTTNHKPSITDEGYCIFNLKNVEPGNWKSLIQYSVEDKVFGTIGGVERNSNIILDIDAPAIHALGKPLTFNVKLFEDKHPIEGLIVNTRITRPTLSINNALKKYQKLLVKVKPDTVLLERGFSENIAKLQSYRTSQISKKDILAYTKEHQILQFTKDGYYTGTINKLTEEGIYTVEVSVTGVNPQTNRMFSRTQMFSVLVGQ